MAMGWRTGRAGLGQGVETWAHSTTNVCVSEVAIRKLLQHTAPQHQNARCRTLRQTMLVSSFNCLPIIKKSEREAYAHKSNSDSIFEILIGVEENAEGEVLPQGPLACFSIGGSPTSTQDGINTERGPYVEVLLGAKANIPKQRLQGEVNAEKDDTSDKTKDEVAAAIPAFL